MPKWKFQGNCWYATSKDIVKASVSRRNQTKREKENKNRLVLLKRSMILILKNNLWWPHLTNSTIVTIMMVVLLLKTRQALIWKGHVKCQMEQSVHLYASSCSPDFACSLVFFFFLSFAMMDLPLASTRTAFRSRALVCFVSLIFDAKQKSVVGSCTISWQWEGLGPSGTVLVSGSRPEKVVWPGPKRSAEESFIVCLVLERKIWSNTKVQRLYSFATK